jgi:DNA-binding LytR/AlgR family response regulator
MTTTAFRSTASDSTVGTAEQQLKVLLVDDPAGLDQLCAIASPLPYAQIVAAASSKADARAAIALANPDLIIVNVELGDDSGFDVAAAAGTAEVVFLASSGEFAADAFKFNAVDYLVKPVRSESLLHVILRARERMLAKRALEAARRHPAIPSTMHGEGFWVKYLGRTFFVPISSISWVEAHGEYVRLHADGRAHLARLRMNDLEELLQSRQLIRVHRSAFVRLDSVKEVKRDGNRIAAVRSSCGQWVAVGARYEKAVRNYLRA